MRQVIISEDGSVVTHNGTGFDGWQAAVCGDEADVMTKGQHYIEVTWLSGEKGQELLAGVVGPGG